MSIKLTPHNTILHFSFCSNSLGRLQPSSPSSSTIFSQKQQETSIKHLQTLKHYHHPPLMLEFKPSKESKSLSKLLAQPLLNLSSSTINQIGFSFSLFRFHACVLCDYLCYLKLFVNKFQHAIYVLQVCKNAILKPWNLYLDDVSLYLSLMH